MEAKIVRLYVTYTTTDDRGVVGGIVGYFASSGEADYAATGKGYFGGMGTVRERYAIKVGDRYYLLAEGAQDGFPASDLNIDLIAQRGRQKAEAKSAAMAALTPEQRKDLGLDF
ncbi:hypothetical protein CcrColossus_gp171 [Caulobacter phage CcrColossus]|uniref:Uncharacterized protein n=1 Tax=Caulobacter phage CcrColossus TaxID=1211640 RepID=K4JSF5_9CAUD|nr:hypothetical protein CcrColossus_gp171 [Caulobacter phage CcrColossus]AFU88041.1 hypothetical protein CcrColossus_gp171 [Caulobacter phage CcrColossus]